VFARRPPSLVVLVLLLGVLPRIARAQCDYSVNVIPKGDVDSVPPNSTDTVWFGVGNTGLGDCYDLYTLTVYGTDAVTNARLLNPNQAPYLYPGQSETVGVIFDMGALGTTGTVALTAQGFGGSSDTDNGYFNVVTQSHGPKISLSEYNGSYRDVTKCVANCFDAVAGYTTVPYRSQDTPRSVQLMYRSSHAHPMATVHVAAWDTTTIHPEKMSIQLKYLGGGDFTSEVFFACDSTGGHIACDDSSTNRLAVQFDASDLSTGAHPYIVAIRSYYPGGGSRENDAVVRVLVENDGSGPFGAGWSIAGFQRVHADGDSAVITDGTGSIAFFARESCAGVCTYLSPDGDFSTLTSDGSSYTRTYRDGSKAVFYADGRLNYLQARFDSTRTTYKYNASNLLDTHCGPRWQGDRLQLRRQRQALRHLGSRRDGLHGRRVGQSDPDPGNHRGRGAGDCLPGDVRQHRDRQALAHALGRSARWRMGSPL
jgi:hypothetical protein